MIAFDINLPKCSGSLDVGGRKKIRSGVSPLNKVPIEWCRFCQYHEMVNSSINSRLAISRGWRVFSSTECSKMDSDGKVVSQPPLMDPDG